VCNDKRAKTNEHTIVTRLKYKLYDFESGFLFLSEFISVSPSFGRAVLFCYVCEWIWRL
jgi:hypothetical protein